MPGAQLSIRSERAKAAAHRLAKRHRRTVTQVVEMALDAFEKADAREEESGRAFVERLLQRDPDDTIDIDLEELIREGREPHQGIDLE
jgi:hypothetical protein